MNTPCERPGDWLSLSHEIDRRIAEARRLRSEAMGDLFVLAGRTLAELARKAWRFLSHWRERAALAAELNGMTDHQLHDIGLNRCDIDAVVDGIYRSERGRSVRRRPLLVRLDAGVRRIRVERITADTQKAA